MSRYFKSELYYIFKVNLIDDFGSVILNSLDRGNELKQFSPLLNLFIFIIFKGILGKILCSPRNIILWLINDNRCFSFKVSNQTQVVWMNNSTFSYNRHQSAFMLFRDFEGLKLNEGTKFISLTRSIREILK